LKISSNNGMISSDEESLTGHWR